MNNEDLIIDVEQALSDLPRLYAVIMAMVMSGLSFKEIADALDVDYQTLYKSYIPALKKELCKRGFEVYLCREKQ